MDVVAQRIELGCSRDPVVVPPPLVLRSGQPGMGISSHSIHISTTVAIVGRKVFLVSGPHIAHVCSLVESTADSICAFLWAVLAKEAHCCVSDNDCGACAEYDQKDNESVRDAHC